jgi:repressor LexA
MNEKLTPIERKALDFISRSLTSEGSSPSIRKLMKHLGYKSTRSASLIVQSLIEKNLLAKRPDGKLRLLQEIEDDSVTAGIPLVGTVPCGLPLLAEENIEAVIPVSKSLVKNPNDYFLLRAMGDSMDLAGIKDKDLVLVKKQPVASEGEKVVALIDDEATIKVLHLGEGAAALTPKSSNPEHKPIIVGDDFSIQGVVVGTVPSFAY